MTTAAAIALLVAMINVPLAYGDIGYGCNNSSIVPEKPVLKSIASTMKSLAEGDQIIISTAVLDRCGMDHPAIVIFEVRDSNDVTVFLGLQNFTLQANSQAEVALSWVPGQAGEYQLRALALVSFDSPGAADVASAKIDVAESDHAVVVIPHDPNPSVQPYNFEPNFIQMILGVNSTVTWINMDSVRHRLAGGSTLDSSKPVDFEKAVYIYPGFPVSHTFTEAGLYEYYDRDRPLMRGFIRVLPNDAS